MMDSYDIDSVNEVMAENMRLKKQVKGLEAKLDAVQEHLKWIVDFASGDLITDKLQRFYFWPERRVTEPDNL